MRNKKGGEVKMAMMIDEDLINELEEIKNKDQLIKWLASEYENFSKQYILEYAISKEMERQWEVENQIVMQKVNDILNLPTSD